MVRYLITSKHAPDECTRALTEELARGPAVLEKFVFGCKEGDHTGYAITDAKSLSDALGMVPDFLQDAACITKVEGYSPAEIRALHKAAA